MDPGKAPNGAGFAWIAGGPAETILVTNARLRERLGYAAGELEGRSMETILSVGGRVFYHTHFFPLLKLQGSADEIYFSLESKSGDEIPALVNAARRERGGQTVNDCVLVQMRQRHRTKKSFCAPRRPPNRPARPRRSFCR